MKRQHPSEGTYKVFYARSPEAMLGNTTPTLAELHRTHVLVYRIQATDLEDAYRRMQAEQWSPNGEARELIKHLGLTHTSMSVGDVVQAPLVGVGPYYVCTRSGWEELPEGVSDDPEAAARIARWRDSCWTHDDVARMRQVGEPLIEQLITSGEEHNPYLTFAHVRAWRQDIWVREHLEEHGYLWNGEQFTRSTAAALRSQCCACAIRTRREVCGLAFNRPCPDCPILLNQR